MEERQRQIDSKVMKAIESEKYSLVAYECEKIEIDYASEPNFLPSPFFYCSFLLAYLITNDLNNARFLWKRIPQEVKKNNATIHSVWKIGRTMWQREYEETYKAITVPQWEPVLQPLLRALVGAFRQRTAALLTKSYTTISLSDTCSFLGLNEQDAAQYVHNLHWTNDPNTKFFVPSKEFLFTQQAQAQKQSGAQTLYGLSDKTVFLELN